jgi:hypothetical protein
MHRIPATALGGQRNPQQINERKGVLILARGDRWLLNMDRRERKQDAETDKHDYLGERGDGDSERDREILRKIRNNNLRRTWRTTAIIVCS